MKARGGRNWKEVGRTELLENTLDPEWSKTFLLDYYFEEKQVSRKIFRYGMPPNIESKLFSLNVLYNRNLISLFYVLNHEIDKKLREAQIKSFTQIIRIEKRMLKRFINMYTYA